jgi:hypothetical protein
MASESNESNRKIVDDYDDAKPSFHNVMDNGGTSYVIKKYNHKPIVSIFNEDKIILVKRYIKFYEENGAYLLELLNEKYQYVFVGGTDVYEFNLIKGDKLKKFGCHLGNSSVTYAYIIGEKYTYFLSDLDNFCAIKNSSIKNKLDPYESLYEDDKKHKKISFDMKVTMNFDLYYSLLIKKL